MRYSLPFPFFAGAGAALLALIASLHSAHADWPSLDAAPRLVGGGEKDAALIVTVEKYMLAPKIPGATRNGEAWRTYLVRGRGVAAEKVIWLRDQDAVREGIEDAAERAAKMVEPGGTLWFVFIGHGAASKDKQALLVGADAQRTEQSLRKRSVTRGALLDRLRSGGAARVTAVLDACHSGSVAGGEALAPGLQAWELVQEKVSAQTLVLTAAQGSEVAGPLPYDGTRPAFSYLVLGGLRGWADEDHNGDITAAELREYAAKVLRQGATDRHQTPQLEAADPGAVVAKSMGEAAPDLLLVQRPNGTAEADRETASERGWYARKRVWGGIALGVGLAAAGAGLGIVLSAPMSGGPVQQQSFNSAVSTSYILYGVGGAAAVTGLVLLLLGDSATSAPAKALIRIVPTLGGVGLAGRF